MSEQDELPTGFSQVQAQWVVDPQRVPMLTNVMLPQFGLPAPTSDSTPDAVYLTFGHMNSPMIDLASVQGLQQEGQSPVTPITPVAHLVVTIDRLRWFTAQLQEVLSTYDENAPHD